MSMKVWCLKTRFSKYLDIYIYIYKLKINKDMEKFLDQEHCYHSQSITKPENCGFGAKKFSSLIKTQC